MSTEGKRSFGLSEDQISLLSDEELDSLNAKIVFVRDAMPPAWLDHADELIESAELLWLHKDDGLRLEVEGTAQNLQSGIKLTQQPNKIPIISRPYILLGGFALENLIKGLLVAQNPSHIISGKLSKDLISHKLLTLASKVTGLSLSVQERQVCLTMQDALPYWGRYPIPVEHNEILPEVAVDEEFRRVFLALCHKLGKQLYGIIRDGWDSGVGPQSITYRSAKYEDEIISDHPLLERDTD